MNGEKVRARRIAIGMSQAELAKMLGKSQAMVSDWELGRYRVRRTMAPLLANILKCKISDLEGDVPNTVCEKRIVEVESDAEFVLLNAVLRAFRAEARVESAKQ